MNPFLQISALRERITLRLKFRKVSAELARLQQEVADREAENSATQRELLEKRLMLIGSIVHVWSQVETKLSLVIQMIHVCGGDYAAREALPRELDRKLDYLKKSQKDIPALSELANEINSFLIAAHAEKGFRHSLIHGAYYVNDYSSPSALDITLTLYRGRKTTDIVTKYSGEQLVTRSKAMVRLSKSADLLLSSVYDTLVELMEGAG